MTAAGELTGETDSDAIPDLDDVAGDWVDAADLAHLPSLRNQIGQGHVNADLSSMSWLAAPPYTIGYHTGVLRLDGVTLPAQRFRWKPWGVQREHTAEGLTVRTDARMALADDLLLWTIELHNESAAPVECVLSQDLLAMVAETPTGWGWLYDVPWNSGNYHDFMTLERIRAGGPYLLGPGTRIVRLGRPRLPGIQRDADTEAMSMAYELPRHVSQDTVYPHAEGVRATVRRIRYRGGDRPPLLLADEPIGLEPSSEVALGGFELHAGHTLELDVRLDAAAQTGIVLTHGNHPDSLQLGVDGGRLWIGIAGEQEYAGRALDAGRWYRVAVDLGAERVTLSLDGVPVAGTRHWTASPRWTSAYDAGRIMIADGSSAARAAYAFATPPTSIDMLDAGATATWRVRVAAGQRLRVGVVCAYGSDADAVTAAATTAARNLPRLLVAGEDGWRRLWRGAFTPGNTDFSGHLPTLTADDPDLARSYYMGALLAVYLRNVRVSATEPIFLTGGPRLGPTTTFFWDHTEWSRLYALLEPAGLRSWLLRALAVPHRSAFGFDTRNGGPLGNDYVSTDYALFRLVEHYVCITGDRGFLDERAGDATVFAHLDRLAHGWRDKRTAATGGVLADFGGDPWRLLECVPNYVNVVASFNAAYAGMMRSFAGLLRSAGRPADAAATDREAGLLAAAVIALALPGGRWQIRHPAGVESIGHCLDFGLVAAHLHADLTPAQRTDMVGFVAEKLLASTWMRALAADDPAAPFADRPDHGAAGAFGAWPGVTAHGLAKLGRKDLAVGLLRRAHRSASGGLWGQAMEIVTDHRGQWVRVAEAGVSNRDAIAGVATAEAVLSGLFEFDPSFRTDIAPAGRIEMPGIGTLSNVNVPR